MQGCGSNDIRYLVTYVDQNRERVSTESAYFTQDVLARPNLRVAIHATVTKIILEKSESNVRAVGVEFKHSRDGARYQARAKRDIILS